MKWIKLTKDISYFVGIVLTALCEFPGAIENIRESYREAKQS